MDVDYTQDQSNLSAQQKLAAQLLQPLLARRRPSRILVLKREGAQDLPLEPANSMNTFARATSQIFRHITDEFLNKVRIYLNEQNEVAE